MRKFIVTGYIHKRIAEEFSEQRISSRLDGVCFVLGVIMVVLLAVLAVRSALRLDVTWDAPWYHFPFAAKWAGLGVPHQPSEYIQRYFEGFPPLAHIVQGILWRISGSINATGVVNFLGFGLFLYFCWRKLKAPVGLVALIALTAPMVLIHTTVSHIDLFANAWLAIGVSALAYAYLYQQREDPGLFAWAMVGLIAAAWSKFLMVPLVGAFLVLYFVFYALADDLTPRIKRRRLFVVIAVSLMAAIPCLKNFVLYGNPFWPMEVPFLGDLLPHTLKAAEIEWSQTPPPLRGASKLTLFIHSLFEIDHPASYAHRHRWTLGQGRAWLAFRMGGFWAPSVAVFLVSAVTMAIAVKKRRGLYLSAGILATLFFVAFLPQSFVSRYYLFIPLCWAAIIGMLFPEFRRRFPRSALGLLLLFGGLFVYVSDINRQYYKIEKIGFQEAAKAWRADAWWPLLKSGKTYCAVAMEPIGFFLTGPTLSEYKIIDRKKESSCPEGTTVIRYPEKKKKE